MAACTQTTTTTVEPAVVFSLDKHWPLPTDFPGFVDESLLVTNSGDDTLSVIRTSDGVETFRAPLGLFPMEPEGPHHVVVSPDLKHLFVPISNYVPGSASGPHGSHGGGTANGQLLKLDASTLLLVGTARLDRSPGDVLMTRDGGTVFVSHYDLLRVTEVLESGGTVEEMAGTVAIINAVTLERRAMVATCAGAHGMALNQEETQLFVACALTDEIAAIDLLASPPSVSYFPVGTTRATPPNALHEPYALTLSPGDGRLWVSMFKSRTIKILDPDLGTFANGPSFDASPMFGAFTADGQFLVPLREIPRLAMVNVSSLQVTLADVLPAEGCVNAHAVTLSHDGSTAFMVCEGDHTAPGTLVTYLVAALAAMSVTPVGVFADAVVRVRP
jgi:DNA-binding beta-propeller fold protein YncE